MQQSLTQTIKQLAREVGFDLVGIVPALPHEDVALYDDWLAKGYAGEMGYLQRGRDRRSDPRNILASAKSLICVGLNYYRGQDKSSALTDSDHGWISRYAWGDDYHDIFAEKFKILESQIQQIVPGAQMKSYCDTGAILERSYAASAGLGWIGKNTCLIDTKMGSYFFIGEILIDLDLEYDQKTQNHCGTCTRCIDICPTQALTPYSLDATKCISYLTIEYRGEIAEEMRQKITPHVYGCDLCQEACPWNRKAPIGNEIRFDPREGLLSPQLNELEQLTEEGFAEKFRKSPIKRTKWKGLQRNVQWVRNGKA